MLLNNLFVVLSCSDCILVFVENKNTHVSKNKQTNNVP